MFSFGLFRGIHRRHQHAVGIRHAPLKIGILGLCIGNGLLQLLLALLHEFGGRGQSLLGGLLGITLRLVEGVALGLFVRLGGFEVLFGRSYCRMSCGSGAVRRVDHPGHIIINHVMRSRRVRQRSLHDACGLCHVAFAGMSM